MARDERARALAALDIAFGQQLLICRNNGRTSYAELRCHSTRGWHACARTECSRQHGRAHLHVDLPRERRAAPPIELPSIEVGPSARRHRNASKWSAAMSETGPYRRSSKGIHFCLFPAGRGFCGIGMMTESELLDLAWTYPLFEAL